MSQITDEAVDIAAQQFINWARDQHGEDFERHAPGLEGALNALTAAGILEPDFQSRVLESMKAISTAEEEQALEDFFGS